MKYILDPLHDRGTLLAFVQLIPALFVKAGYSMEHLYI